PPFNMPSNTFQRVVQLLGDAQTSFVAKEKLDCLSQVRELIFHREPSLLDNFLDEFMDFQHDKHAEVRRAVVEFIELACKYDNDHLRKGVERLYHIIQNDKEKLNVIKRVIGAHTVVYKLCLSWLARSKDANKVIVDTFGIACKIKERILALLASDNEGIRAFVIKFLEAVVLTQSRRRPDSEIPKAQEKDVSLDQIPLDHRTLNIKRLEDEGKRCFDELLTLAHSDSSSICLQVGMNSLVNIALQRPQFMARAVASLETLHVNLPPQLATSQVTSVRKCLKQCLLSILRHPSSLDHQQQVATLLTDLGATQAEVVKAMPRVDEATRKRRQQEAAERLQQAAAAAAASASGGESGVSKRPRLDDDAVGSGAGASATSAAAVGGAPASSAAAAAAAAAADDFEDDEAGEASELDKAAEKLVGKLTPANVSDLVLLSMVMLPDSIPPAFQSTYTPIAAAGTPAQIGHLSRLLAAQLLAAGLAPDGSKLPAKRANTAAAAAASTAAGSSATTAETATASAALQQQKPAFPNLPRPDTAMSIPVQQAPSRPRQQFSLHKAVTPLTKETQAQLARMAFERLLYPAGHVTSHPGLSIVRQRLLSGLTAQFGGDLYQLLFDYVVEDVRRRWELLVMLLYHEYTRYLGYTVAQPSDGSSAVKLGSYESYDRLMSSLCNSLQLLPTSKELYFAKLLAEAPLVTDSAFEQLRTHCMRQPDQGLKLLRDLALSRPQPRFLIALLQFAACGERPDLRAPALDIVKELYIDDRHDEIRDFALQRLELLVTAFGGSAGAGSVDGVDDVGGKDAAAEEAAATVPPPAELFCLPGQAPSVVWTDDARASCLHLAVGLLPLEHSLLRQLASAFARLKEPQSKRLLLRLLEGPAASVGQASPELLRLVRGDCPDGAEPMLVRLVQLLASSGRPDPGLVDAVRQSRSRGGGDARLLVAVLPGMTNDEILAALPRVLAAPDKLARLGLQRLLADGPLPPEDLLVAVHEAEFSPPVQLRQCLQASQQIFASTSPALTLESLASALKRLANPSNSRLPTLLFRSMMQAHSMYPRLAQLVLSLLPSLASHPSVLRDSPALWEGFVRCCARLKPAGYGVLLTCLPADRLADAFRILPELRQALSRHAANLAPQQRATLAPAVLALLAPQQQLAHIEVAGSAAPSSSDKLAADRERLKAN
ncbi:hypothetical protein BOX15_Mlig002103g2, partial [Macrostomum lignano]